MLQRAHRKKTFDTNCVDSLGRGALTIAIDAEHLEMVELLVIMSVETKDALLQAINAEFVEAVELLLEVGLNFFSLFLICFILCLTMFEISYPNGTKYYQNWCANGTQHEELIHKDGDPYVSIHYKCRSLTDSLQQLS